MSQRLEKRVQVYMDSGHIHTRRSTTDFDYILDEPIILEDDEAVTVKLGYLSLNHDFQHNHSHIKSTRRIIHSVSSMLAGYTLLTFLFVLIRITISGRTQTRPR